MMAAWSFWANQHGAATWLDEPARHDASREGAALRVLEVAAVMVDVWLLAVRSGPSLAAR